MNYHPDWLLTLDKDTTVTSVDGLVLTDGYEANKRPVSEVVAIEKAL